jgi:hypothetical protein
MLVDVVILICAVSGAWLYFEVKAKRTKRLTDVEIDTLAERTIDIAGRAALNAGNEATQQFHREHPERCYINDGLLFSPEYEQISHAAQQATYAEIVGIALACGDSRIADAIRRNDTGMRSAVSIAAQQRHNDIRARLDAEAPTREAEKLAYDAAIAEARAGIESQYAAVSEVSADALKLLESITPAQFAQRQKNRE